MSINTFKKIYAASLNFLTPLTLEETFKRITEQAIKLTNAKYGSLFLSKKDGFERVYASLPALYKIIPRKDGNTARIFKNKDYYLLNTKLMESSHPQLKILETGNDLSIALTYNKIKIGVLSLLSSKNKNFGEQEIEIIKLYRPVATLAIRKAILYEEVKKLAETQDFFIAIAAHELKTPMTTISLYSQLIEKSVSNDQLPKHAYVKNLLSEEKRLTKLIDELLQINHIRIGKLKFKLKKCDLKEIISSSIIGNQKLLSNHFVRFQNKIGKEPALIKGDPDKLQQMVGNLLSNAVKYSYPMTKISITLKFSNPYFILQIKDLGRGISEKDLPFIFERFYQSNSSKEGGMGLGLYLVKHIVEKHNGEIEIRSEIDKGTLFTIKLPKYKQTKPSQKTNAT